MHKTLILSLLFAMFLFPVNGQASSETEEELERMYYVYLIRSLGWECDKILSVNTGRQQWGKQDKAFLPDDKIWSYVREIRCQNSKAYYLKNESYDYKDDYRWRNLLCHEGVCHRVR